MNDRQSRINKFNEFKYNAANIFGDFATNDESHKRLNEFFALNICPDGRHGGLDEKQLEIFYGNRPIGLTTIINDDWQPQIKIETVHGATLHYLRTDHGHVICSLRPAKSENQRPIEDSILLDYIKNPIKLEKLSNKHWKMFISYMEATCIDGDPNVIQRLRVFYLKNFKKYIVNNVLQERKAVLQLKDALSFLFKVGLSGFLIVAYTSYKDNIEPTAEESNYKKLYSILEEIRTNTSTISNQLTKTNTNLEIVIDNSNLTNNNLNILTLNNKTTIKAISDESKAINKVLKKTIRR